MDKTRTKERVESRRRRQETRSLAATAISTRFLSCASPWVSTSKSQQRLSFHRARRAGHDEPHVLRLLRSLPRQMQRVTDGTRRARVFVEIGLRVGRERAPCRGNVRRACLATQTPHRVFRIPLPRLRTRAAVVLPRGNDVRRWNTVGCSFRRVARFQFLRAKFAKCARGSAGQPSRRARTLA